MSRSLEPASKGELCISSDSNRSENLRSAFAQALRNRRAACVNLWDIASPLVSSREESPIRLFQNRSRITVESQIATSHPDPTRITAESPSESQPHHRITTESRPHDSRITATRQLTHSRISVSGILPTNLFQGLRIRRSICFKLWDFAEPCVSSSEKSPTCLFQNHSRISHITAVSQPDHSLKEIADPLISSSDQSRTTATSQPNHSHIIATLQSQPNHSHTTHETEPLRSRRSTWFMSFMLWELADPLVSSSKKSRLVTCFKLWEIADLLVSISEKYPTKVISQTVS